MRLRAILRAVGNVLLVTALLTLPPLGLAWYDGDGSAEGFFDGLVVILTFAAAMLAFSRGERAELRLRDGFVVTTAVWGFNALAASVPFVIGPPHLSWIDAIFESTSALTTTGATVIVGLDHLPRSVLLYRQLLQLYGGMGIVVLAVAILPTLRVGSLNLTKGETTGPIKDTKLTPRIAETAAALWGIYIGLVVLCACLYWLAGMSAFDAIALACSTVATGGMAPYDANFGRFDAPVIELICIAFMILSACNYALHFLAWRRASTQPYWRDVELRYYLWTLIACVVVLAAVTWQAGIHPDLATALRRAGFHVVSMITSTGFTTTGFTDWGSFAPVFLILLGFIGGCAGSAAGGLKMVRITIVAKQAWREVLRVIHPRGQFPVRIEGGSLPETVLDAVAGFFTIYVGTLILFTFLVMLSGLDPITAFSVITTSINNTGPALGLAGSTFAPLNDFTTWICALAMLIGRLEIFTLLVLLVPAFWRD